MKPARPAVRALQSVGLPAALLPLTLAVAVIGFVTACGDAEDDDSSSGDDTSTSATTAWYMGCGDPVCGGYTGPFTGVNLCTSETLGDACAPEGEQCDPEDGCNALMVCATEDPTQQDGGCPISLRSAKRDVRYLGPTEVGSVRDTLMGVRLATWNYNWDPAESRPRLGFIIDDQPGSVAIQPDGRHVDLYGYTSLAVAAAQAQQSELELLREEVAALRAEMQALKTQRGSNSTGMRNEKQP
jgi:hypothetical protein